MWEWIIGLVGTVFSAGGWGTVVAIVAAGIGVYFIYRAWNKSIQDKASKETKDQAAADHLKEIEKNQKQSDQIAHDEALANEAHSKK